MDWLKLLKKSAKTTAMSAVPLVVANPEQIIIDIVTAVAIGAVQAFFNWKKHRKD